MVLSTTCRMSKSSISKVSLPASIFEKSRMSLMIVSSESAHVWTVTREFALLHAQLRVDQQARHADDAVHGRADFVAHVGQELALGLGGTQGGVARAGEFHSMWRRTRSSRKMRKMHRRQQIATRRPVRACEDVSAAWKWVVARRSPAFLQKTLFLRRHGLDDLCPPPSMA